MTLSFKSVIKKQLDIAKHKAKQKAFFSNNVNIETQ